MAELSQEEAAKELQVSRGLLSQIENAKSPYTQRLLERAAEVYGCSPTELLSGPKHLVNADLLRRIIVEVENALAQSQRDRNFSPNQRADIVVEVFSFLNLQGNRPPAAGEIAEIVNSRLRDA